MNRFHSRQPTPKQVVAARKRRERALQYGLQAASNLQKRHESINNSNSSSGSNNNSNDYNVDSETCASGMV